MPKEQFPAEFGPEKKDIQRRKWDTIRTFLLAGSILVNGGFLAEKAQHEFQLQEIEDGTRQSFTIDQPNPHTDSFDLGSGQRAHFELVKSSDGWVLTGRVEEYHHENNGKNRENLLYALSYELPPLPPEAVQEIFNKAHELEARELKADTSTVTEPVGSLKDAVAAYEYLSQLIDSARSGTLRESRSAGSTYEVTVDLSHSAMATVTTRLERPAEKPEVHTQKFPLGYEPH